MCVLIIFHNPSIHQGKTTVKIIKYIKILFFRAGSLLSICNLVMENAFGSPTFKILMHVPLPCPRGKLRFILIASYILLYFTYRDHLITINELISAMKQIQNIPQHKLQKIAETLDENKDGRIDINDVIKVSSKSDSFISF